MVADDFLAWLGSTPTVLITWDGLADKAYAKLILELARAGLALPGGSLIVDAARILRAKKLVAPAASQD